MSGSSAEGDIYIISSRDMTTAELSGFPLHISGDIGSDVRVIRLCGPHDAPLPELPGRCCLVSLHVDHWNERLSPWQAPPLHGTESFTGGAGDTLAFLTDTLLPYLDNSLGPNRRYLLAGYSLAGLFALWSSYSCSCFTGVAAVSPSLWFPGWFEYASQRQPLSRAVYLSLGDREEKTRNRLLATVGEAIRKQYQLLARDSIPSVLEWNPGNHFRDSEKRMAKGIAWLLQQLN